VSSERASVSATSILARSGIEFGAKPAIQQGASGNVAPQIAFPMCFRQTATHLHMREGAWGGQIGGFADQEGATRSMTSHAVDAIC
jgi:hypothetical protein